jgi:hypothetical protein
MSCVLNVMAVVVAQKRKREMNTSQQQYQLFIKARAAYGTVNHWFTYTALVSITNGDSELEKVLFHLTRKVSTE